MAETEHGIMDIIECRMSKLILTFVLLLHINCFSQNKFDFENDSRYLIHGREFISKLNQDTLNDFDFQLRFWKLNKGEVLPSENLLVISLKNEKWICTKYIFHGYRFSKSDSIIVYKENINSIKNFDNLFNQLISDSLFCLNKLYIRDFNRMVKSKRLSDLYGYNDGVNYCVELFSKNKKRGFEIKCPRYLYDVYKLDVIKHMFNVIRALMSILSYEATC